MLFRSGVRHTVAEWGKIMGINPSTIRARLKRGWPVENAITEPKRGDKENERKID